MRFSPVEFSSFDGDYVKRLSDGDSATETHFVNYFSAILAVKLRRRLPSVQEVEDLRQEVFLRVLNNLRTGDGVKYPERFGAYVSSVCNHVISEHQRQQGRTSQLDPAHLEPANQGHSAEHLLLTREAEMQIHVILSELSEKDQGLLRAVFFEERDKDSVCKEFGVTRDYLRVLLHRAKNRVRQILAFADGKARKAATNAASTSL